MLGRQLLSKTAMAARLPDPIVTYGSLSVEPWGWIVKSCGPVASTPPRTSAAPISPWYLVFGSADSVSQRRKRWGRRTCRDVA